MMVSAIGCDEITMVSLMYSLLDRRRRRWRLDTQRRSSRQAITHTILGKRAVISLPNTRLTSVSNISQDSIYLIAVMIVTCCGQAMEKDMPQELSKIIALLDQVNINL